MSLDETLTLTGLMGAGKSTVAGEIAARSGRTPVDTDAMVEAEAGRSIREIFADVGEAGFRALERDALEQALAVPEAVVAAGGGAVLDIENRRLMHAAGEVVWLTATPAELGARIGAAEGRPLLDGGDVVANLTTMASARGEAYADCDRRVATDGRAAGEVADAVLQTPIDVGHGDVAYQVHVSSGGLEGASHVLRAALPASKRLFVVADKRAAELHGDAMAAALRAAGFSWETVCLDPGEGTKGTGTVTRLWHRMALAHIDRDVPVLAFGGGVVSDVAGYAAASWKRGIPWAVVPTTLLGQVDASIGGKTGINLPEGKNLVGAFHPPRVVYTATDVLATLPDRELRGGLAEVVKAALVGDGALLRTLDDQAERILARDPSVLPDIVRRAVAVKADIVTRDPMDRSKVRRALNLGHTAGHAIESASAYSRSTHGEAVALGMIFAIRIAVERGSMTANDAGDVARVMARLGLPTDISAFAGEGIEVLRQPLAQDKKALSDKIQYIIPEGIGAVTEISCGLDELLSLLGRVAAEANHGGAI